MFGRLGTVALSLVLLVGFAPASGASDAPDCSTVTDDSAERVHDRYVRRTDGAIEVWTEANGLDGLQTESCVDEDGEVRSADQHDEKVEQPTPPSPPDVDPDDIPHCFNIGGHVCLY